MFLVVFGPLTQGAERPAAVATIQIVTALALGSWWLSGVRGGRIRRVRTTVDIPLAALLTWATLSLGWSIDRHATGKELHQLYLCVGVFLLIVNTLRSRRALESLVGGMVLWGTGFAVFALSRPEEFLGRLGYYQRVVDPGLGQGLRATFDNHANFAGCLSMIGCLALGLALSHRGSRRALLLFSTVVMAVAVFLSLSRGGIVGLIVGLFVFGIVRTWCRGGVWLWLVGLAAATTVGLAVLGPQSRLVERLGTLANPLETAELRLSLWREGLGVVAERPWLGSGLGTYLYASPPHQSPRTARFAIDHPHNEYLERTAELGWIGGGLLVLVLVAFFGGLLRGLRRCREPTMGSVGTGALAACVALLVQDVGDFQFSIPSNAFLFSICAAIATSGATSAHDERPGFDRRPRAVPQGLLVAVLLLVTAGSVLASVRSALGDHYAQRARQWSEVGQLDRAKTALGWAIRAEPGAANHREHLGGLLLARASSHAGAERAHGLEQALAAFDRAIERSPRAALHHSQRARVLLDLGRDGEARGALEQAVRLAPTKVYYRHALGQFYRRYGETEKALNEYRRALELGPLYADSAIRQILALEPDPARAQRWLPQTATVRQEFARLLAEQGRTADATRELGRVVALEPRAHHAHEHLKALVGLGVLDRAWTVYQRYRVVFPESVPLRLRGADLLLDLGEPRAAATELEEALTRCPFDVLVFQRYLEVQRGLGEIEASVALSRQLLRSEPRNPGIYLELGHLLNRVERPQDALDLLHEGLRKIPGNAALHFGRVEPLRALDRPAEALEALRRAVVLEPDDEGYRSELRRTYEALGLDPGLWQAGGHAT